MAFFINCVSVGIVAGAIALTIWGNSRNPIAAQTEQSIVLWVIALILALNL